MTWNFAKNESIGGIMLIVVHLINLFAPIV